MDGDEEDVKEQASKRRVVHMWYTSDDDPDRLAIDDKMDKRR